MPAAGQPAALLHDGRQKLEAVQLDATRRAPRIGKHRGARQGLELGGQGGRPLQRDGHGDAGDRRVRAVPIKSALVLYGRQAVLPHLEDAQLVRAAVAVLGRAQHPVGRVPLPGEDQHRVHHVLQQHGPRQPAILGDVPHEHRRHAVRPGGVHQPLGDGPHLIGRPGPPRLPLGPHGLDAVQHDEGGVLHILKRSLQLVAAAEQQPVRGHSEPGGAEGHLRLGFLARDVEHGGPGLRDPPRGLEQQRRLADARLAAEQDDSPGDQSAAQHPVQLPDTRREALRRTDVDGAHHPCSGAPRLSGGPRLGLQGPPRPAGRAAPRSRGRHMAAVGAHVTNRFVPSHEKYLQPTPP